MLASFCCALGFLSSSDFVMVLSVKELGGKEVSIICDLYV